MIPDAAAKPRILVTNDDGIDSPGLRVLARRLAERFEVVVAAPDADMSGSGTGIGRIGPDGVELQTVEMDGMEAYAIAGPPGLAVMANALGAFGRQADLVVSGINAGVNTGHSVIHSGTVGAALTARTFGARGLAVSLTPSDPWHWDTAAAVALDIAAWMLANDDAPTVLNVNVPAVPLSGIAGVSWAGLDDFGHFRVASTDESGGRVVFDVEAGDSAPRPDSDSALCRARHVTLTPLSTVEPGPVPGIPGAELCPSVGRQAEVSPAAARSAPRRD
ncbi:MAG: 5'/3'-nucleotidase SurE [Rhodospirillaceae bacterium]